VRAGAGPTGAAGQRGSQRGWWWQCHPGEPGRGGTDGRGRAGGHRTSALHLLLLRPRARDTAGVRRRGHRAGDVGLPALRVDGQPGLAEPAAAHQDRAVQDAPGLREGASQRRRGRRHPERGAADAPRPSRPRRRHLL
ncbi:MAG: putative electron transport protein, partial [uncultured Friedmanniella sp.]